MFMMLPKSLEMIDEMKAATPPSAPELLMKMTSQRFIKSHLPIKLLPYGVLEQGCKIVYVARNPKDVAVSYYHFVKNIPLFGYEGDFEQFVDLFIDDLRELSLLISFLVSSMSLQFPGDLSSSTSRTAGVTARIQTFCFSSTKTC